VLQTHGDSQAVANALYIKSGKEVFMGYFSGIASPRAMLQGASDVFEGWKSFTSEGASQFTRNMQAGGTWSGAAAGAARAAGGVLAGAAVGAGILGAGAVAGSALGATSLASAASATTALVGAGVGAVGVHGGYQTIRDNMKPTGTWGGVAQGAVQMATGLGGVTSAITGSAAATAVNAAGTFINDFATAPYEPQGMANDARMARGAAAGHMVPLMAVAAAVGGPAGNLLNKGATALGRASLVATTAHHLARSVEHVETVRSTAAGFLPPVGGR
jgi:hypothetical protein